MADTFTIIDQLVAQLQSMQPVKPEYQQKLDKKIRLEFNYNSNHIEGNTLTYGETELLLIFDKTTGNHELREYEEMKAHDVAFEMIKEWAAEKERPLTEAAIKNLHEILLVRPFWKEAITPDGQPTRRLIETGAYKKYPNSVRLQNGEIFHYASPEETPIQMGELIDWYKTEDGGIHPVTLAAMLHYKFVRIHPFDDGNGRISRLLMNYVLLKHNLPPVIIKSTDKKNYLFALNQADTGNYAAFIEYIAEQLTWSLELNLKAARGEELEEYEDVDKEIVLWKRQLNSIERIAKPRSDDYIVEIYIKFLNHLFREYEQKLTISFADLFAEFKVFGFVNNSNVNNQGQSYIEQRMRTLSEVVANATTTNKETEINLVEIRIQMNGFKKNGANTFSLNTSLSVDFQPFKYIIKYAQNKSIEKLYGEWLLYEEKMQILSQSTRDIFEQTKASITE